MNDKAYDLRAKIYTAPDTPGVYLMKDKHGELLYIGKANSLRKRLLSYLAKDLPAKTAILMAQVSKIEFKLCPNESLALLLEASLINQYKPKYNVSLRDDKSFPYVKITKERFPRIFVTRKKESDGAMYLGPYTSGRLLNSALKIIRRSFPYRSCKALPRRACIYYRLGLSPAPCIGKITGKEYARTVNCIRMILEGKVYPLIQGLLKQMDNYARELDFENAAKIRDKINALSVLSESREGLNSDDELDDLKKLLGLKELPVIIEAFDISNISGRQATGSMVSFSKGRPDKKNYRRFRIKSVHGVDDYAMLSEVVSRRYLRLVKNKLPMPNLILIDGGKAHLIAAQKEIKKLSLDIPLVSIAKEEENIYIPSRRLPIKLNSDTPALNLIRRIRDEAHRFALSYHRLLRRKEVLGR